MNKLYNKDISHFSIDRMTCIFVRPQPNGLQYNIVSNATADVAVLSIVKNNVIDRIE